MGNRLPPTVQAQVLTVPSVFSHQSAKRRSKRRVRGCNSTQDAQSVCFGAQRSPSQTCIMLQAVAGGQEEEVTELSGAMSAQREGRKRCRKERRNVEDVTQEKECGWHQVVPQSDASPSEALLSLSGGSWGVDPSAQSAWVWPWPWRLLIKNRGLNWLWGITSSLCDRDQRRHKSHPLPPCCHR